MTRDVTARRSIGFLIMNQCARCGTISARRLCPTCDGAEPRPAPISDRRRLPAPPGPIASSPRAPATARRLSMPGRNRPPTRAPRPPGSGVPSNPAVRDHLSLISAGGEVVSTPAVSPGRPGLDQVLRAAVGPLLVLAVLTNAAILGSLLLWLIMLIGLIWLLGRMGLGGLFSVFSVLSVLRGRRRSRTPRPDPPTLSFRYSPAGGQIREVRLVGHDMGVQLGDRVEVRGVAIGGTVRALSVSNHTTGAMLRRAGLAPMAAFALVDAWLLTVVVSQVAAL